MRILKVLTLSFAIITLALSGMAWAHCSLVHTLSQLSGVIANQIEKLESIHSASQPETELTRKQAGDVIHQGMDYQKFARKLIRKKQHVGTAKSLEQMSEQLVDAARAKDLNASLTILKQMQALVQTIS